jgi:Ala-tRNA(Pro) deacylase
MNIAPRVQDYLAAQQCAYDVVSHAHSANSIETAHEAHVPAGALAKAVVLKDPRGYVLAVLPSTRHVVLSKLGRALHREPLELASEAELSDLFGDCEWGALPPLGRLYGLPTVVDEALDREREVYFEAGDHEHLVHMAQAEFYRLTSDAPRERFSRADEEEDRRWMQ